MKKHKYFRNLDYKNKLEMRYNRSHGRYCCNVFFLTEDIDPRFVREEWASLLRCDNTDRLKYLYGRDETSGKYKYWDRPEVAYSVHEYVRKHRRRKEFFKKYDNRVFRRKMNKCEEILPSGGDYKKYCYAWWY